MTRARLLTASAALTAALALASCGNSTPQAQNGADVTPAQEAALIAKRAKTWPTEWCDSLHVGMTRDNAVEAMGSATETGADYDEWAAFGYSFSAFYDEYGTIRQLDYSTDGLTGAQTANLTCKETRQSID